jgi:hypothetical protein
VILDAGFWISVDRNERAAKQVLEALDRSGGVARTSEPVIAQVWRDGARQAVLAGALRNVMVHPFLDGREVGRLLGRTGTSDVVDAHLVLLGAQLGEPVLTGDPDDLQRLAAALGPSGPTIHAWP